MAIAFDSGEKLRSGDRSVVTSLNNLVLLYKYQGKYAEAEPFFRRAVEIAENSLGVNHPNKQTFRQNLEMLRQAMDS